MARDEYYSYLPQVFQMLLDGKSCEQIVVYLVEVEDQRMGLRPNRKEAVAVAEALLDWKNALVEKYEL